MERHFLAILPLKCVKDGIIFNLDEILNHFNESIESIEEQFSVAKDMLVLNNQNAAENIWRSQIVFITSALDFYMHELTKYGLSEIYSNNWDITEKYNNLKINMKFLKVALSSGKDDKWFYEYISNYNQNDSIVAFKSIKNQFKLLGIDLQKVANEAFYEINGSEKTQIKLQRRLTELNERRNIIAHQTDRTLNNAIKQDISEEIVRDFIEDTKKIVKAIDKVAREKNK